MVVRFKEDDEGARMSYKSYARYKREIRGQMDGE